jgi:hypothetical protein
MQGKPPQSALVLQSGTVVQLQRQWPWNWTMKSDCSGAAVWLAMH